MHVSGNRHNVKEDAKYSSRLHFDHVTNASAQISSCHSIKETRIKPIRRHPSPWRGHHYLKYVHKALRCQTHQCAVDIFGRVRTCENHRRIHRDIIHIIRVHINNSIVTMVRKHKCITPIKYNMSTFPDTACNIYQELMNVERE